MPPPQTLSSPPLMRAARRSGVPRKLSSSGSLSVVLGANAVTSHMVSTFETGGVIPSSWFVSPVRWDTPFTSDALAVVSRPELIEDLTVLLRPNASSQYLLIVGESGTGKSTAVRKAIRALPSPKGAIYFSAPQVVTSFLFSEDLASATGYFRLVDPLGSLYNWLGGQYAVEAGSGEPHATWAVLSKALLNAATAYHAKHGRPAVLIVTARGRTASCVSKSLLC